MADPTTAFALSAVSAYVAKDTVTKLLGPTADFLGTELKEFAQRRLETIGRIFQNGAEKANDRLNEDGAVPPRVVRDIINDGSFQDDDLAVEYFGGVLASSRTRVTRDDRAATFTSLISRLSTYQIRSHFIFYTSLRTVFLGKGSMGSPEERKNLEIYIPFEAYVQAMDFNSDEINGIESILQHVMFGLDSEKLVENFQYGRFQKKPRYEHLAPGIAFRPSVRGAELFLRANGLQSPASRQMLSQDWELSIKYRIMIPPGCSAVKAT